ncbi:HigA family addiction module antidote protein [Pseudaminobacter sp. 19-2017]|uniref:HigA family addiction module antidote protein n=1 Tax=Pseudaminobacter soli (ex Zhang et al. 2022) TaxID=2831468 RepID=A0A942I897_9HYPH|nr:HigA family addiction module antitoxin [Pseudaminobacter soli]MBS3649145.1 HigA family addiction module antidote protein [Pseudaminobacter soli]
MSELRPRPVHPGEILREEFLPEYSLTPGSLAKALHVPRDRIEKLVREKRAVTADTAMRLARYFNTTPQFWMNLQANHDLATVAVDEIAEIEPRAA